MGADVEYRSWTTDSSRWRRFAFRPGDVVISTPPKSGTTWTQMLCGLLIFDGDRFPAALDQLSPWVDMRTRPIDELTAALDRQPHRRFMKTHTPLDGVPLHDDVTYLVVGRDPRDVALSYHHHRLNMNFDRFLEQRAAAVGLADLDELPPRPPVSDDPEASFQQFLDGSDPAAPPPNLANVLHHLEGGWRLRQSANVGLLHFADLQADLVGELQRLADMLAIELTPSRARQLAAMAGFDRMRGSAGRLAPGAADGFWNDPAVFFRAGGGGDWRTLPTAQLERYRERVAALAAPELAAWAHGGGRAA